MTVEKANVTPSISGRIYLHLHSVHASFAIFYPILTSFRMGGILKKSYVLHNMIDYPKEFTKAIDWSEGYKVPRTQGSTQWSWIIRGRKNKYMDGCFFFCSNWENWWIAFCWIVDPDWTLMCQTTSGIQFISWLTLLKYEENERDHNFQRLFQSRNRDIWFLLGLPLQLRNKIPNSPLEKISFRHSKLWVYQDQRWNLS